MRNLLLVLVITTLCHTSEAQTKIAIKAGWNYSTARVYYKDTKQPSDYKSGFGIGVQFKMPFEDNLYFTPSVTYNQRGYTYKPTYGDTTKFDNTINYIDIVPALSYDFHVGKGLLAITAGPHLSVALSGTQKLTDTAGVTTSDKMIISNSGNYGFYDVGLHFGAGYHFKKLFIQASYQLGLANINNNVDLYLYNTTTPIDPRNIRNRMLNLSIGYYIK